MTWLTDQGYCVWIPVGHSRDADLIAERDAEILRVQVKTTTVWRHGRWTVTICTRGGNRSWSGLVKRFSPGRCDRLFVHVGDAAGGSSPRRPSPAVRASCWAGRSTRSSKSSRAAR